MKNRAIHLFPEFEGIELIQDLHKRLYSGKLRSIKPNWLETNPYNPHVTVGKLNSRELMIEAEGCCSEIKRSFKSNISKVCVEEIDEDDNSIIELEITLK